MAWDPSLISLRNVLAQLFPSIPDSRRIVDAAGLSSSHIAFDPAAITNWHTILTEAVRRGMVEAIVNASREEYPENAALRLAQLTPSLSGALPQQEIQAACRELTIGTATSLQHDLPFAAAVARPDIDSHVDRFLASDAKWCALVGQSGVGKSILMANNALRLMGAGWTVLLVKARKFYLDEVARSVIARIGTSPIDTHWYRVFIGPWNSSQHQGFVLMIDGLDEQNRDVTEAELTKLNDELEASSEARVKVIVSSGEVAWQDLRWGLPQFSVYSSDVDPERIHIIQVDDFDDSELNLALTAIRAVEYLASSWTGGRADPEVDTVRELLSHPATFAVFGEIRSAGVLGDGVEITWAQLLHRFVNLAIGRVAHQCRVAPEAIRGYLIQIARLAHESGSQDFQVDVEVLRSELSAIAVDVTDPRVSPCAALLERGLLQALEVDGNRRTIGFRRRNVGSYFLSFALAKKAEGRSEGELQNLIAAWLEGVYDYPPVIDAIVAWAHRLDPDDPMHATLVSALITNPTMRLEVIFRIMPPSSARAILAAIGGVEEDQHLDPYRTALIALPPSAAALRAFRNGLESKDTRVLRLSIRAVGSNRDAGAVPALMRLLEHQDADIRRLTTRALGLIGSESVPRLLLVTADRTQPMGLRIQSLIALRATRYRAPELYDVLRSCLSEDGEDSAELRRHALLAAAATRQPGLTSQAVDALESADSSTVLAAAKLLTEVPNAAAGAALLHTLHTWSSWEVRSLERYSVTRQVIVALYRLPDQEPSARTIHFLQECLVTNEPLTGTEVAWICEAIRDPRAKTIIFERLIQDLKVRSPHPHLWQFLRILAGVWEMDSLYAMAEASQRLGQDDADVARVIVGALLESLDAEGEHPLKDQNAQRNAMRIAAKCGLTNLAAELARLLPEADWPLDQEICDILWILGDRHAESALLAKHLDSAPEGDGTAPRRRDGSLYTLATCGTTQCANAVLDYLRSAGPQRLETNFPDRVLVSMLRHGVITATQVAGVLRDESASEEGRIASLLALAQTDAWLHKDEFVMVLNQDGGPMMLGFAAAALGLSGDTNVVPLLERLVRASDSGFVVERAAGALARLSPLTAVRDIEQALTRYVNTWEAGHLALALGYLKNRTSIPVLLDALEGSSNPPVRGDIIRALGEFLPDEDARQAILEQLNEGSGGWTDMGQQVPAIQALARHDPNYLLAYARDVYDLGGLEPSSKQALCHWIGQNGGNSQWNEELLKNLLERLVADQDAWVREQAAQAMVMLSVDLCQDIFEQLERTGECWKVASAVRTLGYWSRDVSKINVYRSSTEPQVRDAGDHGLEMMRKRWCLEAAVDNLGSNVDQVRVAAFYVLEEHGDESTIWQLFDRYARGTISAIFVDSIQYTINSRRRNEHRKLGDHKIDTFDEVGVIRFD